VRKLNKYLVFIFLFALVLSVSADETLSWDRVKLTNGWMVYSFEDKVVPTDTVFNSSVFSLPRDRDVAFDDTTSLMKTPMCFYVDVDSATYGTNGDVTYKIFLQGTQFFSGGTFTTVDTLYNSTDADSTVTDDTLNLNGNLYPLYPYYRVRVQATGVQVATPDTNDFKIKLW